MSRKNGAADFRAGIMEKDAMPVHKIDVQTKSATQASVPGSKTSSLFRYVMTSQSTPANPRLIASACPLSGSLRQEILSP